jgi:Icc-related predicted phosphoesterase
MWHDAIKIPDGDVILHTGDFGVSGEEKELVEALTWFRRLPHEHKICIAGNHDRHAEANLLFMQHTLGTAAHNLHGSGVEIDGVKFWGSPIQPEFRDWAFNRSKQYRSTYWDKHLPTETDILLTHCPPRNILDENYNGEKVGCKHIARNVQERVKPHLHVFGHIHEARGCKIVDDVHYVNASVVNLSMNPVHKPWVLDYNEGEITLIDY